MAARQIGARAFSAAVIVLAVASGCTSTPETDAGGSATPTTSARTSTPTSTARPVGALVTDSEAIVGSWRAVEIYGQEIETERRSRRHLDLSFEESDRRGWSWSSTDLCNGIGGRFTITHDGAFDARSQRSTLAACIPGSRVGEQNINAIADADQAWLVVGRTDRSQLTLSVDGERVAIYISL